MEQQPLVSIVVVSYNHSSFIRENLDSIMAQTYKNIELIVADDASSDNSVEVFESWLTENNYRAKKNFHSRNTGLATMLNECLEMVNGKYVKIIAADDYLHNDYIRECVSAMQNENSQIVFTQAFLVNSDSEMIREKYFPIPDKPTTEMEKKLSHGNFVPGATLCFEKEVLNTIGNYDPNILLEDYDFILRAVSKALKISFINDNLIFYRKHNSNITKLRLLDLEVETEKLKYKYLKKREFAPIINTSTRRKVNLYGKNFSIKILYDYLKYPHRSNIFLFKMILSVLR